jgi:hypothetical protein
VNDFYSNLLVTHWWHGRLRKEEGEGEARDAMN